MRAGSLSATARGPEPRDDSFAEPKAVRELAARLTGVEERDVDLHETHISWVFVADGRAFKLRKPVRLAFLDYGTPERRRSMSEAEVSLGRRLAPHIYRAVHAVVPGADGLALGPIDDPRAVDYIVEMTAFAQSATLAAAIGEGRVPPWLAEELGARLAAFHSGCPVSRLPDVEDRIRHAVRVNAEELRRLTGAGQDRRLDRLVRLLDAALTAQAATLGARGADGLLREGHGDLRAEHVLLTPELAVLDPLEFDPGMRTLDPADELGFLVMDLLHLGAEPLARAILHAYRQVGGDCGGDELVWMFAVHRALVRAKVQLLREDRAPASEDAAAGMLRTAERCAWRARSIAVLVICGGPATGKSHLTGILAERLALPSLNTDVVRKDLLGIGSHERAPQSAYTPGMSLRTYRQLGTRTRALLTDHPSVIVDGTFRRRRERMAFLEGLGAAPRIVFVQCTVPVAVARERARARAVAGGSASDATEEVVRAQAVAPAPFPEVSAAAQIILRTDRPPDAIAADLDAMLDVRLRVPGG